MVGRSQLGREGIGIMGSDKSSGGSPGSANPGRVGRSQLGRDGIGMPGNGPRPRVGNAHREAIRRCSDTRSGRARG